MARPKFHVQHFVACLNAAWDGTPGPRTTRTLERVGYDYAIPPDTEFPFEEFEFWVYARFYRVGTVDGPRTFALDVFWHDAPGGVTRIGGRSLGTVRFSARFPVVSAAWPVRPLVFPGEGMYEFQLLVELHRSWGSEYRPLRSEFIRIARQP
jgi:hypothetical protein